MNRVDRKGPRGLGAALLAAAALCVPAARAQDADMAERIAAQKSAMARLAFMDGVWRGEASTQRPDGSRHEITQTERIGPLLDGSVKVIEGRGYESDGRTSFNALGVVWFDPATQAYAMRSWALGRSGEFALTPNGEGFVWVIPAGPATIRYTATVKDGRWHEVGDRLVPGKEPQRFFEMNLKRVGDSAWPAADAVPPR
jgi:hypothetical protein